MITSDIKKGVHADTDTEFYYYNSETMGHSFWFDQDTLWSCPTNIDGTPDTLCLTPVEDWCGDPLDSDQFRELIQITQKLTLFYGLQSMIRFK